MNFINLARLIALIAYSRVPDNFLGEKNTNGSGIPPIKRDENKTLNDPEKSKEFWNKTTNL